MLYSSDSAHIVMQFMWKLESERNYHFDSKMDCILYHFTEINEEYEYLLFLFLGLTYFETMCSSSGVKTYIEIGLIFEMFGR